MIHFSLWMLLKKRETELKCLFPPLWFHNTISLKGKIAENDSASERMFMYNIYILDIV